MYRLNDPLIVNPSWQEPIDTGAQYRRDVTELFHRHETYQLLELGLARAMGKPIKVEWVGRRVDRRRTRVSRTTMDLLKGILRMFAVDEHNQFRWHKKKFNTEAMRETSRFELSLTGCRRPQKDPFSKKQVRTGLEQLKVAGYVDVWTEWCPEKNITRMWIRLNARKIIEDIEYVEDLQSSKDFVEMKKPPLRPDQRKAKTSSRKLSPKKGNKTRILNAPPVAQLGHILLNSNKEHVAIESSSVSGNDVTVSRVVNQELLGNNAPSGAVVLTQPKRKLTNLQKIVNLIQTHFPDDTWSPKLERQVKRWVCTSKLSSKMSLPRLERYFRIRECALDDTWHYQCNLATFLTGWASILKHDKQDQHGHDIAHTKVRLAMFDTVEQDFEASVRTVIDQIKSGWFLPMESGTNCITGYVAYSRLGLFSAREYFVRTNRNLINASLRDYPNFSLCARKLCPDIVSDTNLHPFEWHGMKANIRRDYQLCVDAKHSAAVWGIV